ncbi:cell wall-binding repeat-containing protein [Mobiluncus mulieris]|uniref:Cell wall-binding repeat-containing protein n=1 Tax=Mobiluncus mulieris TaxID=2052 RepID=A0ABD4TZ70_9ACTO|nr:cell wall-binding repeat-containing protein [Mobiluncus mulieris]MCU9968618.1 cell wall-binding repeat-containing protein [Mobiluncus mulieris]MCU9972853.1 cell wall-binding repeat-containing protein [Mobiluncus mulieris]MCV0009865.1 cell wall-binding repeat-containing protein [Mobiluncus mulieris]NMW60560.1 cell wall-binding repeat-containing protein [Mobiluncus mulieris]NMW74953.1 cell wall-binding repeat-containing protein [Mobiluncus mulieris]
MLKLKTKLGLGIATFSLLSSIGITPAIATTSTTVPVDATPSARLAGTNRVDTALKVATHAFKGQKPRVMYLASSEDRHLVDATTAGKLADGPVLYAPNSPDAAARLTAAIASNPIFSGVEQVTAIGGTASVHEATLDTVAKALKASQTGRLAGADRYATAEAIATHVLAQAKAGNPAYKNLFDKNGRLRAVYLANGSDAHLVDSMVAGTLGDGPTLLTRPDGTLSEVARQLLAQAKPVQVTGLGGARALPEATLQAAAAVGSANASRLGGANRFATAASIAKHYTQIHGAAGEVYVAGGAATADAIIAGQLKHGPILLVKPSGETPTETASVLRDFAKNSGKHLMIYGIGGQASLPEAQLRQAAQPDGTNGKAKEKPKAGASGSSGGSSSSGSSGGGFGGGSSSSGGSGSSPAPAPQLPNQVATPNSATLTPSNPKVDITVKIGANLSENARVGAVTLDGQNATDKLQVMPKAGQKGVFTVASDSDTPVGSYLVTFEAANAKPITVLIIVQNKHTTPPVLLGAAAGGGASVPNTEGQQVIAKFDTSSANWRHIIEELKRSHNNNSYTPSFADFQINITNVDIPNDLYPDVSGPVSIDPSNGTISTDMSGNANANGKKFRVSFRVKGKNGYTNSEYNTDLEVTITAP